MSIENSEIYEILWKDGRDLPPYKVCAIVEELWQLRIAHSLLTEQRDQLLREMEQMGKEAQNMAESIEMVLMMRGVG